MKRPSLRSAFAISIVGVLLAAACGNDAENTTTDDAENTATDEPEDRSLRITTLGLCNEINTFWALDRGVFERHGLDVELIPSTGGSAGLAAVTGGSADLSFTNALSALLAYNEGFPINYVASLYEVPQPPEPEVNTLIVKADSDIEGPDDLVGRRIGVNELGGINQLVTQNYLRVNDVDPTQVNFVALPFPELAPAVVGGRLDAAQVPVSLARSAGEDVRNIADPFREGPGNLVFAGYLATDEFLEENEATVQAFHEALLEAKDEFVEDPDRFEVMEEHCEVPAEDLADLPEAAYAVEVDFELMGQTADILVEEEQISEVPNLEEFVPEWARK